MSAQMPAAASSPEGNIYDLGYRHYEGKRHGTWFAVWPLYVESLRSVWGFGRPMTAKGWPFILAGIYAFPALLQLALSSVFSKALSEGRQLELFTYAKYFGDTGLWILILLFCIAQAPELVCRDQRSHVLSLYFTRPLARAQYAVARVGALSTALFIVLVIPCLALFVGDVLMKADTIKAIGDELPRLLPSLPASALVALGMGSISLGLAAFSPRRAYSTIGLVAFFLIVEGVTAFIYEAGVRAGWSWADMTSLLAPITTLEGAYQWFFGGPLLDPFPSAMTSADYLAAALATIAIFWGLLLYRYRSISA